VGKTNLLYGVARELMKRQPDAQLISVDAGLLMAGAMFDAERENLLAALLKEALFTHDTFIVLEHAERALFNVPAAPWLLCDALDKGLRLIGTALRNFCLDSKLLGRRIMEIELAEMSPAEAIKVLLAHKEQIAAHHAVEIDEAFLKLVIEQARTLAGHYPSKALSVLDGAASRASLNGARAISAQDILLASARFPEDEEYPSLLAAHT
jgi:ATP-dependent Clp protease ATP-binding subunit ClpB